MDYKKSKLDYLRHGESFSPWRIYIKDRVLRRKPSLDRHSIESYNSYAHLVGASRGRLGRPADDSFRIQKNDLGARVLLFGRRGESGNKLSESDILACKDFIEESSHFFGDEVTSSMVDKIIFLPSKAKIGLPLKSSKEEVSWMGFVTSAVPGSIFINSRQNLGYHELKKVLFHEMAHIIHGYDIEDSSDLLNSLGWDVVRMNSLRPEWKTSISPVGASFHSGGELSRIAKSNPRETIAEVFTEFMEIDDGYTFDDIARDAMISYLRNKSGRPLATRLDESSYSAKR